MIKAEESKASIEKGGYKKDDEEEENIAKKA
jgi:hypothetical protein